VPDSFDGMLIAHVTEHMAPEIGEQVVRDYLPYLNPGGEVLSSACTSGATPLRPHARRGTTGEHLMDRSTSRALGPRNGAASAPAFTGKAIIYNGSNVVATKLAWLVDPEDHTGTVHPSRAAVPSGREIR